MFGGEPGLPAVPALWTFGIRLRGASRFSLRPIVRGTFAVASGRPGTWVVAPWRAVVCLAPTCSLKRLPGAFPGISPGRVFCLESPAASEPREFGVALPSQDHVQRQGFRVLAMGPVGAAEEIFFCVPVRPDGQGLVALWAVLGRGPGFGRFHRLHGLHLFLFPFGVLVSGEVGYFSCSSNTRGWSCVSSLQIVPSLSHQVLLTV